MTKIVGRYILLTLSKVYERLVHNQIYPYFDKISSKFQCSFWKCFNIQHCLIIMIEKLRRSVDGGGQAGALLTDLSKLLLVLTIDNWCVIYMVLIKIRSTSFICI